MRKIDACIECKACEKACEERYGVKRLAINGRILGNLDFVDACHTCTDQRCIDPCNFDAISFDVAAQGGPHQGGRLHRLHAVRDGVPVQRHRDARARRGARASSCASTKKASSASATARRARPSCAAWPPSATTARSTRTRPASPPARRARCVEILPSDAVTQLPDAARASAKAGYDRTVAIDVNNLNESQAFVKGGLDIPELGRARAPRKQLSLPMWWTLGIGAFLLVVHRDRDAAVAAEVLDVVSSSHTLVEGIDPELALAQVGYRPGCELAVDFGYTGTALMITGMLYVWRRRFSFMRNVGSLRSWFEWHVLTGVLGPAFILLHSVAKLDNWVSLGFWSMIITVISGLLGRYLTTQIEERASTAAMEVLDIDRQLAKLRGTQPGVRAADVWYEAYRRRVTNFDNWLGGKNQGADVLRRAVDLLLGHARRRHARAAHPPARASS